MKARLVRIGMVTRSGINRGNEMPPTRRSTGRAVLLGLAALTLPACDVVSSVVYPVPCDALRISSERSDLTVGDTLRLIATRYNAHYRLAVCDPAVGTTWTSSAASVATVTELGLVRAVGRGRVLVRAQFRGRDAERELTIRVP